jgi:large subunit ribosomal protein L14
MIQVGTILNAIDNSGAKKVCCIKVMKGFRQRYAFLGDLVMISIKSLRKRRKSTSKTKKGQVYKALIVRTKVGVKSYSGDKVRFLDNCVILLNKQDKFVGTRVLSPLPCVLRKTKFLRILSIAAGLIS